MTKAAAAVLVLTFGCGGGAAEQPAASTAVASGTVASGTGDLMFEISAIAVKGTAFEPEAMTDSGMALVEAKHKTILRSTPKPPTKAELDKQRAAYASAKDRVQKQTQAAVLATLLYLKSKEATPDERSALLKDAREVLHDAATAAGARVDEMTLRLLGSYELINGDYAAAEKAWHALVAKAPTDRDAPVHRAWWVYSLLRSHRNADALAAVADQVLSEKQPELAYAAAWAKWRSGDGAGAWQAIVTAAKGWGANPGNDVLHREVLLFAGRTGASVDDAVTQLSPLYGQTGDRQYALLAALGQTSYPSAGRWADAVAALDKAAALGSGNVPAKDLPMLRYQQAEYTVRLDDPAASVARAKQALAALPGCGPQCSDADKTNLLEGTYHIARLFHILYATANDVRYYLPAHELYAAVVPLLSTSDQLRQQALRDASNLEGSYKAMKPEAGTHDKAAVDAVLARRSSEIQACYESGLAANAKLGGTLVVIVEFDHTGVMKGVATEPQPGVADMAMVAGCVQARTKTWTLPKRANGTGPSGVTRVKLSYSMAPALKAA